MKHKKILILLICLLIFTMACTCGLLPNKEKPAIEINDDGSVEVNATGAAQSEFALQTQIAGIEATQQSLIQNVEGTAQALRPTDDLADPNSQQATATPIDPGTYTTPPAPGTTTLNVSVNTNCRSGPGIGYQAIDSVLAGQNVEVLGVDASGAYYIVRSPNGSTCWLWSHYATVQGDENSLVVMTPPAPPQNVNINDWQDQVVIHSSEEFTWEGHWVSGAPGGQSYVDSYNAQASTCDECFRYASHVLDINRQGDFLDIKLTEETYWLDGSSAVATAYGVAQVSEDNTMVVGSFYRRELVYSNGVTSSNTSDFPFFWSQNGNPNQFVSDFGYYQYIWVPCAAREGAAFPVPCNWP